MVEEKRIAQRFENNYITVVTHFDFYLILLLFKFLFLMDCILLAIIVARTYEQIYVQIYDYF